MWTNSSSTGNFVSIQFSMPNSIPACDCGAPATHTVKGADGSKQVQVCVACGERMIQDSAIARSAAWLDAAFTAVGRAQYARLYKQLAVAFHPDQGGDGRLMMALNAAREKFR
jgi:hypothetical protein